MYFLDTKHERNYLMEKVYPKLKAFCHELGYEFQVSQAHKLYDVTTFVYTIIAHTVHSVEGPVERCCAYVVIPRATDVCTCLKSSRTVYVLCT